MLSCPACPSWSQRNLEARPVALPVALSPAPSTSWPSKSRQAHRSKTQRLTEAAAALAPRRLGAPARSGAGQPPAWTKRTERERERERDKLRERERENLKDRTCGTPYQYHRRRTTGHECLVFSLSKAEKRSGRSRRAAARRVSSAVSTHCHAPKPGLMPRAHARRRWPRAARPGVARESWPPGRPAERPEWASR